MELLSQFLYSENIFSTVIGSHLENSCHFEKKQVANGFYQRGVPMPTFMLVTQSERFFLNNNLICRAIIINPCCFVISSNYVMNTTGTWVQDIFFSILTINAL
jgi:hypothetical protein